MEHEVASSEDQQATRIGNYTSQFRAKDSLGTGAYGAVYVGHQISNPKNKVAIKMINLSRSNLQEVMNEITCMLNNRSDGTLSILATQKIRFGADKQYHYAIVTEKMDGSLRDLLQAKRKLTEKQAIQWGFKIIECYKHLYKAKVIHRDLKPENVLYKKFGNQIIFKIGDFGNSRSAKVTKSLTIGKGSRFYISPQQAMYGQYTDKTDVYAFGCMLFEFLIGSRKQPLQVNKVILNSGQINKKEVEKLLGDLEVSEMMIQFIVKCLMYEETKRYSWRQIFNHPLFNGEQRKNQISVVQKINKLKTNPDTNTYAWENKFYRLDANNKNICIANDCSGYQWLCSHEDLAAKGTSVFTIKALKIRKQQWEQECSSIGIGIMESQCKSKAYGETVSHCVYLSLSSRLIYRPNQELSDFLMIQCVCQSLLYQLPCLIEVHVNRQQNTIAWHYNGKKQIDSRLPQSWKDKRVPLCAIVNIWKGDIIEFM